MPAPTFAGGGFRTHRFQLVDAVTKRTINIAGGNAIVTAAGSRERATLVDRITGVALPQPLSLTRGAIEFAIAESTKTVDIYLKSPTGHFVVVEAIEAEEYNEIYVPTMSMDSLLVYPYHFNDHAVQDARIDTGFKFLVNELMDPYAARFLTEIADASQGIDVGMGDGVETGFDVDGLIDGLVVGTAGMAFAVTTGPTRGVLLGGATPQNWFRFDGILTSLDITTKVGTSDTLIGKLLLNFRVAEPKPFI